MGPGPVVRGPSGGLVSALVVLASLRARVRPRGAASATRPHGRRAIQMQL